MSTAMARATSCLEAAQLEQGLGFRVEGFLNGFKRYPRLNNWNKVVASTVGRGFSGISYCTVRNTENYTINDSFYCFKPVGFKRLDRECPSRSEALGFRVEGLGFRV